jgi:hypothetical protein
VADPQLTTADAQPVTARRQCAVLRIAYGLYAWTLFVTLGTAVAAGAAADLPRSARRRAIVRALAR